MTIDAPGLYDIPASEYHADPVREPSLSSSLGKLLLGRSPLHAVVRHPRLARRPLRDEKDTFDLGSAAHTLLLHDGRRFAVADKPSWQGNIDGVKSAEWKTARRGEGLIPILKHQLEETELMVEACREQLAQHEAAEAFTDGKGEQTIVWREGDVWCRALIDWLPNRRRNGLIVYDYKSTAASAHPETWGGKTGWGIGFSFQSAFYVRGLQRVLRLDDVRIRFVVQERQEPWAIAVLELSPAGVAMAMRDVERVIEIWRQCRRDNLWPGYPARVVTIDPPLWEERRWLEREEREPVDPFMVERMIDAGRPLEGAVP